VPLSSAKLRAHGTHLRSSKTHDVCALGPHGQAVLAHFQGNHRSRQGRRGGPAQQPRAAPRRPKRAADQHAEDKVEAAIKRAVGKDATNYEQIIYEGYAPHGVAVLVECATDNPTRTVASVRTIFSKNGGNLGSTGSVAFQFRKMGVFRLSPEGIDHDDLELYLIDHGLEEMGDSTGEKGEPQIVARCLFADFGQMQVALEKRGITPISAAHEYICTAPIELPEAQANEALAMIDKLEQDDDVQNVYHSLI
jgi:YebC/PmpR family DNA-binding regulatory protein